MTAPTLEQINALLTYNAETGEFHWRVGRGWQGGGTAQPGRRAGSLCEHGYRVIVVQRHKYYEHRLAWFMTHGRWPAGELDHINRVRSDNRLCNLREVSRSQNANNTRTRTTNSSGVPGVYWNASAKRWVAQITENRKTRSLGCFVDKDAAIAARTAAVAEREASYAD